MAKSNISWTDFTRNFWWGCTKVAPGCDNCYAAQLDKRTGGDHWGADKANRATGPQTSRELLNFARECLQQNALGKVFCGSMMDWCDNTVDPDMRAYLWQEIYDTPNLVWQLLTKRAPLIKECLPARWNDSPWLQGVVWLGVTVENKKHGYPRINHLRNVPAAVRFLSCEPLLEDLADIDLTGIHWVIIGGESGPGARPMSAQWARNLMAACDAQHVPYWFKQWGGTDRKKGGDLVDGELRQSWPQAFHGYRSYIDPKKAPQ